MSFGEWRRRGIGLHLSIYPSHFSEIPFHTSGLLHMQYNNRNTRVSQEEMDAKQMAHSAKDNVSFAHQHYTAESSHLPTYDI